MILAESSSDFSFDDEISEEIRRINRLACDSANLRLRTIATAVNAPQVQELLRQRRVDGDRYVGVTTVNRPAQEVPLVLFQFESPRDRFRLVTRTFAVEVKFTTRPEISIQDPYVHAEDACWDPTLLPGGTLPFSLAVPSAAPNVCVPHSALTARFYLFP
jgi:hypothetical protein